MNVKIVGLFLLWPLPFLAVFTACNSTPPAEEAAQRIAEKYGYRDFEKVDMVRYTFHVLSRGDTVSRYWYWQPDQKWFEFSTQNDTDKEWDFHLDVFRDSINSSSDSMVMKADHRFINDNYWLFFPFHLMWDDHMGLKLEQNVEMPLGGGQASRLTVSYSDTAGYTPGDAYELYFDDDHLIKQWSFMKGGSKENSFSSTWEDNRKAGSFLFSLKHQNQDINFHLWFSGVAIKMKGSEEWISAK